MSDRGIAADGPFEKVLKVLKVPTAQGHDSRRVLPLGETAFKTFKTFSHSGTHCFEHFIDRAKE